MNRVKKFLSISLLIFISCGFHTEPGPLHPIPILKVKMGEVKTIDLSKYLKEEKVDLLFNEPLDHISLNGYELTVDASSISPGFDRIFLMANLKIHLYGLLQL